MVDLDDARIFPRLDPDGMGALIAGFADQCLAAWRNLEHFDLPAEYREAQRLLILGMGGSAIGGDLIRTLVVPECRVPIAISREYSVPAWVDALTLVIVSSHSGNTEETLSAFKQARSQRAMIVGVTTGGELSQASGMPLLRYEFTSQPRAALGYSFISLLGIVARLGWIADPTPALHQALESVRELSAAIAPNIPASRNPAKQLAIKLFDHTPVIYGAGILEEVAHRWKTQINENAKVSAFYELMSELNHNSVVGYEYPRPSSNLVFVSLLSRRADARMRKRFEVTRELLSQYGLKHEEVLVEGESDLNEMLWAIHYGDYCSYYLAILNGVDPTPVAAIDFLKGALKT